MNRFLYSLLRGEEGSAALGYALVAALVMLVAYVGLSAAGLGLSMGHTTDTIRQAFTAAGIY